MDKLTKENFWNDLYAKHPSQMKNFCDWVDEYKRRIDWQKLFFTPHATHARDIKYHDLPIAMQIGIFLQYVAEADSYDGIEYPKVTSKLQFDRIPEYIKDFFAYESAIQTHRSPIHPVRLQSDAAEAQNSDQADLEGTDGRGDAANEEGARPVDVGDASRAE